MPGVQLAPVSPFPAGQDPLGLGAHFAPQSMSVPFVTTPMFTSAVPQIDVGVLAIETNQSALAHTFDGALAIAFSPPEDAMPGPALSVSPTIAQTTSETIAATDSHFYADFTAV